MLILPIVLAAVVWIWPRIWFRVVRDRLEVTVHVLDEEVEPLQPMSIEIALFNRSWLPCPYVQVSVELPPGLSASPDSHRSVLGKSTYLLMRQEVRMQFQCYGWQRGLQNLGNREMILRMNEGFGIKEIFISRAIEGKVRVLPVRRDARDSVLLIRELSGELERMHWLMPDEALLRGIREYEAGDPFKYISWQATARTGTWMTKQFSSSMDMSVGLVLNAQFFEPHWIGTNIGLFDEMCSFISSLGQLLEKQHIATYFASNAVCPENVKVQWYGRQTGWGMRRLCGTFAPYTTMELGALLLQCAAKLPRAGALLVVTAFVSPAQASVLERMAWTRSITIACPTSCDLPTLRGVRVIRFNDRSATAAAKAEEGLPS